MSIEALHVCTYRNVYIDEFSGTRHSLACFYHSTRLVELLFNDVSCHIKSGVINELYYQLQLLSKSSQYRLA